MANEKVHSSAASYAILLCVVVSASPCAAQSPLPRAAKDFFGTWHVEEVVGYAETGAGVPHAKKLLGTNIVVSKRGIRVDGTTCRPFGGFRVIEVDSDKELRDNAGAAREDAGLPPKVTALQSDNCTEVFWLNEHRIAFENEGVFFRAYRDRPEFTKP